MRCGLVEQQRHDMSKPTIFDLLNLSSQKARSSGDTRLWQTCCERKHRRRDTPYIPLREIDVAFLFVYAKNHGRFLSAHLDSTSDEDPDAEASRAPCTP
jgi:hypothetical protein